MRTVEFSAPLTFDPQAREKEIEDLFCITESGVETLIKSIEIHAVPAYSGQKLYLSGWDKPVIINLKTARVSPNAKILYLHQYDQVLGHVNASNIDKQTIAIHGLLTNLENVRLHEIIRTYKRGTQWQVSVGMGGQQVDPNNIIDVRDGQRVINDCLQTGPYYELNNIEIAELSIVPLGADRGNPNFLTIEAALRRKESFMAIDKEKFLACIGEAIEKYNASESTVEAEGDGTNPPDDKKTDDDKTVAAEGDGSNPPDDKKTDDDKTVAAEGDGSNTPDDKKTVEASSIPTYMVINGKKYYSDPAEAKFGGENKTESGPRRSSPNGQRTVEAALLMTYGQHDGKTVEAMGYSQNEINEAVSSNYRGMTLHQFYYDLVTNGGRSRFVGGKVDLVTKAIPILQQRRQTVNAAGLSTVYDTGIFGNVLNKEMLKEYEDIEDESDKMCSVRKTSDFKSVSSWRLNMQGAFEEVGPGEQFPTAKFTDQGFEQKVKKSGLRFDLTFEDQVNDDMGAFLDNGRRVSRLARIKKIVARWKTIMDQIASLPNAAKCTGALGPSGLNAATKAFRAKKDTTGNFVLARPSRLIVPPALEATADELYVSREYNETTTANKKSPSANTWMGKYKTLVTPYIGADGGLGGTDTNWFLIAEPSDLPCMQELQLDGFGTPNVKTWEVNDTLSIAYLAFYAWSIKFFDDMGMVYSPGT